MSATYFTDRDLGRQFPSVLRAAGIDVEEHATHFAPTTPDEIWLQAVADRGWTAVSHDRRIRYKPNERDAVMQAGLALLIVIGAAPYRELAEHFVRTISQIQAFVDGHEPPWIGKVVRPSPSTTTQSAVAPGRVTMWLSHEDWLRIGS